MGMVNQCKCDACGTVVEAGKTVGGEAVFPPGWHVVHWQEKNSNAMGSGYVLLKLISYCPKCGPTMLTEATPK